MLSAFPRSLFDVRSSQWSAVSGGVVVGSSLVHFGLVPSAVAAIETSAKLSSGYQSGSRSADRSADSQPVTQFVAKHPLIVTALGGAAGGAVAYLAQGYFSKK